VSLRISGGRRLQSPPGTVARPTAARVRLAVMNLLADRLAGCHWLDLCCGSGVMGCEALQRGAALVVAVEQDRRVAAVARANLEAVARGLQPDTPASTGPRIEVHGSEAEAWLAPGPTTRGLAPFDLIYLDPPWAAGLHGQISGAVAAGGWLAPRGLLVWECSSQAAPAIPRGWAARPPRRYGGSTVLLLEQHCQAMGPA